MILITKKKIFIFLTGSKPTAEPATVGACSKIMTATQDKANVGEELSNASVINEPGDCWETCGKTANCVAANWDPRDPDEPLCTLYSSVNGEEEKKGYQSVKCQQGIFFSVFLNLNNALRGTGGGEALKTTRGDS